MYKSLTKTKKYPELEAQENAEKSGFSKCNIKTVYKFFFNNCKTPCDGSKLFLKASLVIVLICEYFLIDQF